MSKNNIIILIVIIGLVVFFVFSGNAKSDNSNQGGQNLGGSNGNAGNSSPGCQSVPEHEERYDVERVMWGRFEPEANKHWGRNYKKYGMDNEGRIKSAVHGALKTLDVRVSPNNVIQYKDFITRYLESGDWNYHWDELIGRNRCN